MACDNHIDPEVSVIAKIPDNCNNDEDYHGKVSAVHNNSNDWKELYDRDEDGSEEEMHYGNNNDHSNCSTGYDASVVCDVKSPPKRKTGSKLMNLSVIDDLYLKLDYDNLILDKGVIDGLESSDYNECKTQPITTVVHSRKGFWVVTCSDYDKDEGKEGRFNIQQLALSEHETIMFPK